MGLVVVKLCEEEFFVLEIELELWGDEFVGSGFENEVVVLFGEDGFFFVEGYLKEDIDLSEVVFLFDEIVDFEVKLSLKVGEEENEVLLSEVELKKVLM